MHKQTYVRGKRCNQTSPSPCPRVRLAEVHVERSGNDRARNILILEVELVILCYMYLRGHVREL